MNVHSRRGVVPEGWDVIGEWGQEMMEVTAVLTVGAVIMIDMAVKMDVVENSNESWDVVEL